MYAQTFLATLLLAAVGTNAAAMQKQARQFDDLLAGIRGWKDISACDDSTTADFDYNIPMVNGTVSDTCVPLPADLATVQVSALRQDMQVSFFTDDSCSDLTRGTTINVPGNCLNNAIGPWKTMKFTEI